MTVSIAPIKTASLDVDAQKSFTLLCPSELPVPEGHLIAYELNLQAAFAQYRVGTKDAHSEKAIWIANEKQPALSPIVGPAVDVHWPAHCVPGTTGFELIDGLPHPMEYDFFVWKGIELDMHPYGGCYHDLSEKLSTGLIEFLKSHDIESVIVGGLATEYCVKQTVLQLRRAGFKIILNLGACRGITEQGVREAISEMKTLGVYCIESARELNRQEA
ncbi:MAG: isochorismatase family protein [Gammaproteobacteria bacterium]